MMMNLNQTIDLMRSENYKERMKAEYWQVKIRQKRLNQLLVAIRAAEMVGEQPPMISCPLRLLQEQNRLMKDYMETLELRAACEKINLEE